MCGNKGSKSKDGWFFRGLGCVYWDGFFVLFFSFLFNILPAFLFFPSFVPRVFLSLFRVFCMITRNLKIFCPLTLVPSSFLPPPHHLYSFLPMKNCSIQFNSVLFFMGKCIIFPIHFFFSNERKRKRETDK